MASIITDLTCNLNEMVVIRHLKGVIFSGDNAGNIINVHVYDGDGQPVTLVGSVTANVMRSDGGTVPVTGAIEGNIAYVIFPQEAYTYPGPAMVVIKLTHGSTITTLASVIVDVSRSTTGTIVDPGTIIPSVEALVDLINTTRDSLPPTYTVMWQTFAPTFDPEKTDGYVIGEYCTKDSVLYKCKNPHTGVWNASNFEATNVGKEVYENYEKTFELLSENTRNLWKWGDQTVTGTKRVVDNANIPAGTYTVSARITRADSGSSRIVFYKNSVASGNVLANPTITVSMDGSRYYTTVTLAEQADIIVVYSAVNSTGTNQAVWHDVQLESGYTATPYVPYVTAKDAIARENAASANELKGYFLKQADLVDPLASENDGLGFYNLYSGGFSPDTGANITTTNRCRTRTIRIDQPVRVSFNNPNYILRIWGYSEYDGPTSGTEPFVKDQNESEYYIIPTLSITKYIRICFYRTDGAVITTDVSDPTSDFYIINHTLRIYNLTDKLLQEIGVPADAKTVGNQFQHYNTYDYLASYSRYYSTSGSGIAFTWNSDNTSCHAEGTATSVAATRMFGGTSIVLPGIVSGNTYYVSCKTTDENLLLEIIFYFNNSTTGAISYIISNEQEITVPEDITGTYIRIRVNNGATVNADISNISIRNAFTNEQLTEKSKIAAYIDGEYDNMTVGNAKQLVSKVAVEDNAPYNFRTAGGAADIGDRLNDKLIGGTIVWNQLVPDNWIHRTSSSANSWVALTDSRAGYGFSLVSGHKYLSMLTGQTVSNGQIGIRDPSNSIVFRPNTGYFIVYEASVNTNATTFIQGSWEEGTTDAYLNFFDLTQMFGSTIANYIYSLETSHSGDGVAYFRKLFPKPYYAYNAGELMSVQAASHNTIGFNQWDEEWELGTFNYETGAESNATNQIRSKNYIPVVPNTTYYIKIPRAVLVLGYDANKNFLRRLMYNSGNATFLTRTLNGDDCYYIRFCTIDTPAYGNTYNHDICINLHWDGERDGEYEAYSKHEYALGNVELRGIPLLNADNELYYDGDIYEADGTVTRKYGIANLDTLTWKTTSVENIYYAFCNEVDFLRDSSAKIISSKYKYGGSATSSAGVSEDKALYISFSTSDNRIFVKDLQCTDLSSFVSAITGVTMVYELAMTTTESSDPYQDPQIVDDFGTEEYADRGVTATTPTRDVEIPVGHETRYQPNLRAKLEMAPNSPSNGDGDYVVRQTAGVNEYVPIVNSQAEERYARKNGEYDYLVSGNAKQLVSTINVVDTDPYNFRTAGGAADIGDRLEDKLVGGTIVWMQGAYGFAGSNQLVIPISVNYTSLAYADNILTLTKLGSTVAHGFYDKHVLPKPGHKYYMRISLNPSSATRARFFSTSAAGGAASTPSDSLAMALTANTWNKFERLISIGSASTAIGALLYVDIDNSMATNSTVQVKDYCIFDLTLMFGSVIADYIYSLESATSGAGIAWFRKLFPKNNYGFKAATLMSVQAASHDTVGFNAWDGEWINGFYHAETGLLTPLPDGTALACKNKIRVCGNTTYNFTVSAGFTFVVFEYDADDNYILRTTGVSGTFTTSANTRYMAFHVANYGNAVYRDDICVNLSWDGERDGELEEYVKHEYPLGDVELRGQLKLDANNKLYYDGDEYMSDGTVTRKYELVDLSAITLTTRKTGSTNKVYSFSLPKEYYASLANDGNIYFVSNKYVYHGSSSAATLMAEVDTTSVGIYSFYNSDALTTTCYIVLPKDDTISGYLLYKIAEPYAESADPFQSPQIVDDFGTEEYTDRAVLVGTRDVAIPVGHETKYQPNLRAKLEMAPDSPDDGNGDYVVRQTNGVNEYVKLDPSNIYPARPYIDGEYFLQAVFDGPHGITYRWVKVSSTSGVSF